MITINLSIKAFTIADTGSPVARVNAAFGEGTGPIFLSHLKCEGSESGLLACDKLSSLGLVECSHAQDAGVTCPGTDMPAGY